MNNEYKNTGCSFIIENRSCIDCAFIKTDNLHPKLFYCERNKVGTTPETHPTYAEEDGTCFVSDSLKGANESCAMYGKYVQYIIDAHKRQTEKSKRLCGPFLVRIKNEP